MGSYNNNIMADTSSPEFKKKCNRLPIQYWIDHLKLVEHPGDEDGFFREAFRDDSLQANVNSPDRDKRSIATIAHFLQLKDKSVHADTMFFQCMQSSEMLFHHYGDAMSIYILEQ